MTSTSGTVSIGRTASSISMSIRLIYDDAVVKIITEEAETLERE